MTRTAARLARRAGVRHPAIRFQAWSGLWFLTDPHRTPNPAAVIDRLPPGSVVIYRAFAEPGALAQARLLRRLTLRRGLTLLIGADADLARKVKADGVHLPERLVRLAGGLRRARPGWLVTAAAHSRSALLKAERGGVHAILLSAVFQSASASAGAPLGPVRFQSLSQQRRMPVIALGGIKPRTAQRLAGGRAAGLAAIGAFASQPDGF